MQRLEGLVAEFKRRNSKSQTMVEAPLQRRVTEAGRRKRWAAPRAVYIRALVRGDGREEDDEDEFSETTDLSSTSRRRSRRPRKS